jgi:hypothetical protein
MPIEISVWRKLRIQQRHVHSKAFVVELLVRVKISKHRGMIKLC